MNKLEHVLKEQFPNIEIIKLKDITKKIANISKVRVGKNRTIEEYDEISLNDLNEYGIITVPSNPKYLGPANAASIRSQSLQQGDVVLTHRGSVFKVGLVDGNYNKPIVGNNSMIRIQFDDDRVINTPRFVQAYLQLPFVKEHLNNQITCGSEERKILSSAHLAELPIPLFEEYNDAYGFTELLYTRIELTLKAKQLLKEAQRIVDVCQNMKEDAVVLSFNSKEKLYKIKQTDQNRFETLDTLKKQMHNIK